MYFLFPLFLYNLSVILIVLTLHISGSSRQIVQALASHEGGVWFKSSQGQHFVIVLRKRL